MNNYHISKKKRELKSRTIWLWQVWQKEKLPCLSPFQQHSTHFMFNYFLYCLGLPIQVASESLQLLCTRIQKYERCYCSLDKLQPEVQGKRERNRRWRSPFKKSARLTKITASEWGAFILYSIPLHLTLSFFTCSTHLLTYAKSK